MKKDERDPFAIAVGARLARAREAVPLTQAALADMLGVMSQSISNWETGLAMVPGNHLPRIFLVTRINPDYLFLNDPSKLPADIYNKLFPPGKQKAKGS